MPDHPPSPDRLSTSLGRVLAAVFALAAFVVAVIGGMAAGNETLQVLVRALLALIVCYPVGLAIGAVCDRVITAHADAAEQMLSSLDDQTATDAPATAAVDPALESVSN